jgi:hypothetical protein
MTCLLYSSYSEQLDLGATFPRRVLTSIQTINTVAGKYYIISTCLFVLLARGIVNVVYIGCEVVVVVHVGGSGTKARHCFAVVV